MPAPAATVAAPMKRAPSAEEAAVRVQAAARGFLARKSVRAVRDVEKEVEEVGGKIAREAEALRGDAMGRVAVGEALMRMLLRLDAVRGAREYRRRVTKLVLALQDAVDALEARPAPVAAADEENVSAVTADESAVASEGTDVVERSGEIEAEAVEAADEMEVDACGADVEPEETNQTRDAGSLAGDKPEGLDAEGEWEMVTDEPEPAAEPATCHEAPQLQDSAGKEIRAAVETGGAGGLDTAKVMEMVAALCERSAQQCSVIGALAERAVRRVEDAERRRRRARKLKKEGKGSNHGKCYSD